MDEVQQPDALARFGLFEVHFGAGELRKQGQLIKLQEKPLQALTLLLERAGSIVTREEFRSRLWASDTFVEFDDNLNAAIKRLREALGESAENPRFIETIRRRGYRFIPPVEYIPRQETLASGAPENGTSENPKPKHPLRRTGFVALLALIALLLVAVGIFWRRDQQAKQRRAQRVMLAVLPFKNLSGRPDQEYVSDGMTEEMTAQLGRLYPAGLGVIARTSAIRYKNTSQDVRQIGGELGVAYVLEGSVRRDAREMFVTSQLIRVADQTHLWAETYERPLQDIFVVQRDVARRVSESLALQLLPSEKAALARGNTVNTAAYDDYLRGRYEWEQGTEAGFRSSLESFQSALLRDPQYAMAYAGLARTQLSLAEYHFEAAGEARAKAAEAVSRGLELDTSIPDLYLLQAGVLSEDGSKNSAVEEAYRRAIKLDPNNAEAHQDYALYLLGSKRLPEALAEIQKARELDPVSPLVFTTSGWIFLDSKKLDKAETSLGQALRLDPNFPAAMYFLARVKEAENQPDEATAWFERAVNASGRTPKYLHALAISYVKVGRGDEARKLLDELRRSATKQYVAPEYIRSVEASLKSLKP